MELTIRPAYQQFTYKGYPKIQLRMYPSGKRSYSNGDSWLFKEFPPLLFAYVPYSGTDYFGDGKFMLCAGSLAKIGGECFVARLPVSGVHEYACCLDWVNGHFGFTPDVWGGFSGFIARFWQSPLNIYGYWNDYLRWLKVGGPSYKFRMTPMQNFMRMVKAYPGQRKHMQ